MSTAEENASELNVYSNASVVTPWSVLSQGWGHPWHAMCSYLGTFPPSLVRSLLVLLSDAGDIVMDPFSGRGTVLLEARLNNRKPLASDVNPIAVILSRSKNTVVSVEATRSLIASLNDGYDRHAYLADAQVQSDDIQQIFHPGTLAQLCYLRRRLIKSPSVEAEFLLGALLGIMHGAERLDGTSAYLSISMPNTFSMAPNYVRRYVATKRLNRSSRNVFETLESKLTRLFREPPPISEPGIVCAADAKSLSEAPELLPFLGKVQLVITSPPYLGVVNYSKQNWIRNWLLESHPITTKAPPPDDELTLQSWLEFMRKVIVQLKLLLSSDGTLVLVIGDVARPNGSQVSLARALIQTVRHDGVFKYIGVLDDHMGHEIKTTRIWGNTKGKATEVDRIIVFSDVEPVFRVDQLIHAFPEHDLPMPSLEQLTANRLAKNVVSLAG